MSKSSAIGWNELPDWKDETHYSFLDNASLQEWAWEFLRRNPEYRADYEKYYGADKHTGDQNIYKPPKTPDESEREYVVRMVHQGTEYYIIRFAEQCARKWGLRAMFSPYEPIVDNNVFEISRSLPLIINEFCQLDEYFEEIDCVGGNGEIIGTTSVPLSAVIVTVFDISRPVDDQLSNIRRKLLAIQAEKNITPFKEQQTSGQMAKWKLYLRVLDARRSVPVAKHKDISELLGPKKSSKDNGSHEARGQKFYDAACKSMLNYRKILRHSPLKVSQ